MPVPDGTYAYTVTAVYHSWSAASAVSNQVTVLNASADGSGALTTPTTTVAGGPTGNTITFTYTAATGGISNGEVDITVPSGWTAPHATNVLGCTTVSSGTLAVSTQTIKVSALTLAANSTLTVTYGATSGGVCTAGDGATAASTSAPQTWQAQEKSTSGGTLQPRLLPLHHCERLG